MANSLQEKDRIYFPVFLFCLATLLINIYWFAGPLFVKMGWVNPYVGKFLEAFYDMGLFKNQYVLKLLCFVGIVLATFIKTGKSTEMDWWKILTIVAIGTVLFFFPFRTPQARYTEYILTSLTGFTVLLYGIALISRRLSKFKTEDNDRYETFEQCKDKIETDVSINLPIEYQYKKKIQRGWINIVAPFRGMMVLGTPGSGKTFSFVWSFIEQAIAKGYTLFVYDYKMPDLTKIVYNEYLANRDAINKKFGATTKDKQLQFCIIDFDNPRRSMRCNPLNARYLTDMADAHEVADLIMKNADPGSKSSGGDNFFVNSAKVYIATLVWFLKKHRNGIYCSFPHLIELMGKNYEATLDIIKKDNELSVMAQPFIDALDKGALEQLEGQVESARIPLLKFPSKSLYWALTGDDFELDINNPDRPKLVCMGNNPDRQSIYGTTLALYTSRITKIINHKYNAQGKKNLPCGVILDEFPTVFINGIDNLIATARSNRVAVLLGAQDKSQIVRDYRKENADVVFNTVGNIFSGNVNGETAKHLSETFGREFRMQESKTKGGSGNDSISQSFQQREILPQSIIETLTTGYFFGKVADTNENPIDRKLFCGKVLIDTKERARKESNWKPIPDFGTELHFKDDETELEVRSNPREYSINYLSKKFINDSIEEARKDSSIKEMSQAVAREKARIRYQKMTDTEKEELLKEVVKFQKDKKMEKKLEYNFFRIQKEINSIFTDYGIDINNYSNKKKSAHNPVDSKITDKDRIDDRNEVRDQA